MLNIKHRSSIKYKSVSIYYPFEQPEFHFDHEIIKLLEKEFRFQGVEVKKESDIELSFCSREIPKQNKIILYFSYLPSLPAYIKFNSDNQESFINADKKNLSNMYHERRYTGANILITSKQNLEKNLRRFVASFKEYCLLNLYI